MRTMPYPEITICLRSFGRPERTTRMLKCMVQQTHHNFELIFMGDACQTFAEIVRSEWFKNWKELFRSKGNHLFYMNNAIGGRDYGAKVTNQAIKIARAPYFCFADNDDQLHPYHIEYYLQAIKKAGTNFVYCPSIVFNGGNKWIRTPRIEFGWIGHSDLVVETEFLRKTSPHQPGYGQDWKLVQDMIAIGGTHQQGQTAFPTYHIMSLPDKPEPGYENDK